MLVPHAIQMQQYACGTNAVRHIEVMETMLEAIARLHFQRRTRWFQVIAILSLRRRSGRVSNRKCIG
jgi:hypothetical protein